MKGLIQYFRVTIFFIQLFVVTIVSAQSNFDHSETGFQLTGQHRTLSCESCHIKGIFKGIPTTCSGCHDRFSQIGGSMKPLNHMPTRADCDDCHVDNAWEQVRMDHSEISEPCINCHNNVIQQGKPTGHIDSSDQCDDCHLNVSWIPARFDHFGITDTCYSCHNGATATGKNPTHVTSNNVCEDCHSTSGWIPARFDHTGISNNCFSCHNGTTANGKHNTHFPSSNVCEDCHNTAAWLPALFDHSDASAECDSCHNNTISRGKPSGHFITSRQCSECHSISSWSVLVNYSHTSPNYPGKHTGVNLGCYSCHKEKTEKLSWVNSSYYPECAACHAGDYVQSKHEGLPLSSMLDCSGTCHKPNPQHQLYHSDWEN